MLSCLEAMAAWVPSGEMAMAARWLGTPEARSPPSVTLEEARRMVRVRLSGLASVGLATSAISAYRSGEMKRVTRMRWPSAETARARGVGKVPRVAGAAAGLAAE